ncbi:MAG: cupin domain-containing protein [Candidatus Omnitrophica bacterium]|nr:cupin domain-containing protein [Candidatus Omnitrophota bacterium]
MFADDTSWLPISPYVLKGKGTFRLFEEDIVMEEGTCIFMPADAPHSLQAEEDLAILLSLSI